MQIAILPSQFVQRAPQASKLWCLVRSLDHPDNWGSGRGVVSVSMSELVRLLRRCERSVYRYLKSALDKGFIHSYEVSGADVRIRYCSLRRIAKSLKLEAIGAIGEFFLDEIEQARVKACEIETESLQAQSNHNHKKQHKLQGKDVANAVDLLAASAGVSGVVIARGRRILYLASTWKPFGGSQKSIAQRLGVSIRTVQNRLSHEWRNTRGIAAVDKAQTAYQIGAGDAAFRKAALEYAEGNCFVLGRRIFRAHTNLYDCTVDLRCQRRRKSEYKEELSLQEAIASESGYKEGLSRPYSLVSGGDSKEFSLGESATTEPPEMD